MSIGIEHMKEHKINARQYNKLGRNERVEVKTTKEKRYVVLDENGNIKASQSTPEGAERYLKPGYKIEVQEIEVTIF